MKPEQNIVNMPPPAGGQRARPASPTVESVLGAGVRRRKGWFRRAMPWLGLVGVLALGAAAWEYSHQGVTYSYATKKADMGDLTVVVTATGTVQPVSQVDVSTPISGIVKVVNVDYNSVVKKGDVLAELDKDPLEAALASAQARREQAVANLAKANAAKTAANATFTRQSGLLGRGVISRQDFEDAQNAKLSNDSAVTAAEADLRVSEADLKVAQINLDRATITSPTDGVVLVRNINAGSTVAASLSAPVLFSIAGDLKQMEVQVDVDEADVGSVSVGQQATFTVDAYPDRQFPATITAIRFQSETVNNVVTYKAELKVDNADMALRPGMTATADIVIQKVANELQVPNAALRFSPPRQQAQRSRGIMDLFKPPRFGPVSVPDPADGNRSVWILKNGIPVEVKVKTGPTDGQNTIIKSGNLVAGEEVITDASANQ